MNIYAIFAHPNNGRDSDQAEAKDLTPGKKYTLQKRLRWKEQYASVA